MQELVKKLMEDLIIDQLGTPTFSPVKEEKVKEMGNLVKKITKENEDIDINFETAASKATIILSSYMFHFTKYNCIKEFQKLMELSEVINIDIEEDDNDDPIITLYFSVLTTND